LVSLWPASSRPFIGGSSDNSPLQLALGYNGIDRVVGGGDRPRWPGFGGPAGVTRIFGPEMGTEISWLLPAALIGLLAGLWLSARAPRTDRLRASLLLWGGWMLVSGAVFSFMNGTIHPYYTVALAPAVAALVGISVRELWCRKNLLAARLTLAVMMVVTGVWAFVLLDRTPQWLPPLRWVVLIGSFAVALLLATHRLRHRIHAIAVVAMVIGVAAPAAYTIDTVAHPRKGGLPTSGPHTLGSGAGPGSGPGGGPPGNQGANPADNEVLQSLIKSSHSRWAAATVSAMTAGPLELNTGASVMAVGGFSGRDPYPSLDQFQRYVADHQIRYFIIGGRRGHGEEPDSSGAVITRWVQQNFMPVNIADTTVYDLFAPHKTSDPSG
jgi:4-amino-4-deoxy-L-arabinose transferase-like glycosyltransferase